jgi:hypothetical protein
MSFSKRPTFHGTRLPSEGDRILRSRITITREEAAEMVRMVADFGDAIRPLLARVFVAARNINLGSERGSFSHKITREMRLGLEPMPARDAVPPKRVATAEAAPTEPKVSPERNNSQLERSLMNGHDDRLGRMADRVIRHGFLLVLAFATLVLAWYCWTRASIGRFAYHSLGGNSVVLDTKTGTIYTLPDDEVWREFRPPIDRK